MKARAADYRTLDVVTVARRHDSALQACYETNRSGGSNTVGAQVRVDIELNVAGGVAALEAEGSGIGEDAILRCIERRVSGWRFKPPSETTSVELIIDFRR